MPRAKKSVAIPGVAPPPGFECVRVCCARQRHGVRRKVLRSQVLPRGRRHGGHLCCVGNIVGPPSRPMSSQAPWNSWTMATSYVRACVCSDIQDQVRLVSDVRIPDLEVTAPPPAAGGDVVALARSSKPRTISSTAVKRHSCAAYQLPLCCFFCRCAGDLRQS
jgi:hypothetical protein